MIPKQALIPNLVEALYNGGFVVGVYLRSVAFGSCQRSFRRNRALKRLQQTTTLSSRFLMKRREDKHAVFQMIQGMKRTSNVKREGALLSRFYRHPHVYFVSGGACAELETLRSVASLVSVLVSCIEQPSDTSAEVGHASLAETLNTRLEAV